MLFAEYILYTVGHTVSLYLCLCIHDKLWKLWKNCYFLYDLNRKNTPLKRESLGLIIPFKDGIPVNSVGNVMHFLILTHKGLGSGRRVLREDLSPTPIQTYGICIYQLRETLKRK